ncbi:MAG: hypothetical protein HN970_06680 [Rhodospirillaceae bacterium]|nr:hypothetical protein [Rhodospirillaceae bacterium]
MFNLHLDAEQIEFRDTVRSFAANEIRPVAIHPDRLEPFAKPLMMDLLGQASELGLRVLTLSEAAGGVGADTLTSCIVLEEMAAGDVDIAVTLGETDLLGHLLFDNWMTPDQSERFLKRFTEDPAFHLGHGGSTPEVSGWNYHEDLPNETGAGVSAVMQDGDWVIDGSVSLAANAPIADLMVVPVRSDWAGGMSALVVPRDTPGLTIAETGEQTQVRWHHGSAANIQFRSCKVPSENLLGEAGNSPLSGGEYDALHTLQRAAINLGVGQAAFDAAVAYANIRRQGGRNIVEHQAIGKFIAGMAVKLEAARTMIWKAAWVADHPEAIADRSVADLPQQIIASIFTTETVLEVTQTAAECFGAMAVMRDMPLQKYVEDANMFVHSNGNDVSTSLQIAEAVVGYERTPAA